MPVNNRWAAIGGAGLAIAYVVLQTLDLFFKTGQPWPADANGWLFVLVPGVVVGLVGMLTPRYSATERRTGGRVAKLARGDAPASTLDPAGRATMTVVIAPRRTARYGWIPDLPDQRDRLLPVPVAAAQPALPASVSLRAQEPEPCYDQGQLGSCTGNGVAFLWQFAAKKQGLPARRPSRLFIYYYERSLEGTVGSDAGAQIRDGMKVLHRFGAPPESDWPYDVGRFAAMPPPAVQAEARTDLSLSYLRCARSVDAVKRCVSQGFPVVFGFTVYQSFESRAVAQTGLMPMPARGEPVLGGHCTAIVGYDDAKALPGGLVGAFEVRNSWGPDWGDAGHFWMPYAVVSTPGLSSDFWSVRSVEEGA